MWTKPGYSPPAQTQASAPDEHGVRLLACPRTGRTGGEEEFRVHLSEFNGHKYVSCRVWARDSRTGDWWPVKGKGVSIRLGELSDVADALQAARRLADQDQARKPRGSERGTSRGQDPGGADPRRRWDASNLPERAEGQEAEFNEFQGEG
jgi:hypothetical protein